MPAAMRPDEFPSWDDYYWSYQRRLVQMALLPTLKSWGVWREGIRVLDIGCGLGGASFELAQASARVDAVEIDARLAAAATERCSHANTAYPQ